MTNGGGILGTLRARLIAAWVAGLLTCAVQAQVQQVPPSQPYPGSTPAYPNPSYPNPTYPNPSYPNPVPAYPSTSYPNSGYPAPQPAYPSGSPGYPNQAYGGFPAPMPAQPQSHFFRDLFAGTIAAVLQTVTGGLIGAIGGRIMDWFTHKTQNPQQGYPAPAYPGGNQYANAGYAAPTAYPPQTSAYPNSAYPSAAYPSTPGNPPAPYPTTSYPSTVSPAPQYPSTAYPSAVSPSAAANANPYPGTAPAYPGAAPAYPGTTPAYPPATNSYPTSNTAYPNPAYPNPAYPPANSAGAVPPYGGAPTPAYGTAAPQVYDARTGQLVSGAANPYATRSLGMENAIYAGIAYEVHAIGADGQMMPINSAVYKFVNGDKFMVYYRPSLPGHMEIYNVNPKGQQKLIDSSDMAAGQMVALGPYQFTNQTGDESLRLVLTPCSTEQLLAATRDIVRMDAPPQAAPTAPAVRLESCSAQTSRGLDVHTRDIEKVGLEGTTSFALDPLSAQEMKSGKVVPREVSIVFHHR